MACQQQQQQQQSNSGRSQSSRLLVVAIDFGTTYSGYAFSFRHDFETNKLRVHTNQSWIAAGQGLASWKTPTTVLLKPDGTFDSFGYEAEEKYLELADEDNHKPWFYFQRFKMLLHGRLGIEREVHLSDATGKEVPAMTIFAHAINFLRSHLLGMIENRNIGVNNTDINWVLTVPAIWNEPAKQFMREAAVKGGIPSSQLQLALEPEAASLYCKTIPLERNQETLGPFSPETVYMVLDCGGGTVDVTLHEVKDNGTLKEIHRASGGAWGGTKVDASYIAIFEKLFGKETMKSFQRLNKIDHLELLRAFEMKKRKVCDESSNITVHFPVALAEHISETLGCDAKSLIAQSDMAEKIKIRRDRMTISGDIVEAMFTESIKSIIEHVKEVRRNPKVQHLDKILMVGGFSESSMIQTAVKEAFPDVEVVAPDEPGLAVVKGAVLFGHEPGAISSRIIQHTYGVAVTTDFVKGIHPEDHKIKYNNKEYCRGAFSKFLTIDDNVEENQEISKQYEILDRNAPITVEIVVSDIENPVVTDKDCTKLGTVLVKCPIGGWKPNAKLDIMLKFGGPEFSVKAVEKLTQIEHEASFDFLK